FSLSLFPSLPPSPSSPLFPYTTLFRSELLTDVAHLERAFDCDVLVLESGLLHGRNDFGLGFGEQRFDLIGDRFFHLPDIADHVLDRKSTRLNSSHRTISYAVFCLKKKI